MANQQKKKSGAQGAAKRPLFPGYFSSTLATVDRPVAAAIKRELGRQQHEIELIASENIVSRRCWRRRVRC